METGLLNQCVVAWILAVGSAAGSDDRDNVALRIAAAGKHEQQGDYAAAQGILLELLREADRTQDDLLRALVLNNLGSIYHFLDQDSKAESSYRRSIELHERIVGPGDQRTIRSNLNLALHYVETGQPARAERLGLDSLMKRQDAIPGNDPDRARLLAVVGAVKKLQRNFTEAERYYRDALSIWGRVEPEGSEIMKVLNNLGAVYAETGRSSEALSSYQRALEIGERTIGPDHPELIILLANTGAAHYFAAGPERAEPYYRRAVDIGERTLGPQHSLVGKVMLYYAAVLKRMDRKAEAKQYQRRAKAILSASETGAPGSHTVEFNSLVQGTSKRR